MKKVKLESIEEYAKSCNKITRLVIDKALESSDFNETDVDCVIDFLCKANDRIIKAFSEEDGEPQNWIYEYNRIYSILIKDIKNIDQILYEQYSINHQKLQKEETDSLRETSDMLHELGFGGYQSEDNKYGENQKLLMNLLGAAGMYRRLPNDDHKFLRWAPNIK